MDRGWVVCLGIGILAACAPNEGPPEPDIASANNAIVAGQTNTGDPAVGFMLMFAEVNGTKQAVSSCSGTLVAPRTFLTARHCVRSPEATSLFPAGYVFPAEDVKVQFGTNPTEDDPVYDVAEHAYHESADIAALALEEAGPAAPVPMNTADLDDLIGEQVRIAGYGITASGARDSGTKRTGTSTLLATDSGGAEFGELAITGISAEAAAPTSKLCSGDSGGPTFMTIDGTEVLIGVNSFVARPAGSAGTGPVQCQTADTINGEVRVDAYGTWINEFIDRTGGKNVGANTSSNGADGGQAVIGGCASGPCCGSFGWLLILAAVGFALRRVDRD